MMLFQLRLDIYDMPMIYYMLLFDKRMNALDNVYTIVMINYISIVLDILYNSHNKHLRNTFTVLLTITLDYNKLCISS